MPCVSPRVQPLIVLLPVCLPACLSLGGRATYRMPRQHGQVVAVHGVACACACAYAYAYAYAYARARMSWSHPPPAIGWLAWRLQRLFPGTTPAPFSCSPWSPLIGLATCFCRHCRRLQWMYTACTCEIWLDNETTPCRTPGQTTLRCACSPSFASQSDWLGVSSPLHFAVPATPCTT